MVFRANGGDPLGEFFEGKRLLPGIPPANQRKRNQEAECAKNVTRDLVRLLHLAGDKEQEQVAHHGREQNHAPGALSKKCDALSPSAPTTHKSAPIPPLTRTNTPAP